MAHRKLKVLIAGGGTGGHFYSGVAVGEAFVARNAEHRVVYAGTRHGIEAREGPRLGLELRFISVSGLKGKGLIARLIGLARLPLAMAQSLWLVASLRPDIVLGVGGYASGPVVAAGWLLGRVTGVVEQNSVSGWTNRFLGRLVDRVYVGFDRAAREYPEHKVVRCGNPLREQVIRLLALESTGTVGLRQRLHVLVLGGSQGARAINDAFAGLGDPLGDRKDRFAFVHQTGAADEERVRQAYESAGLSARVQAFFDPIAEEYRGADLVVCRAGALTVSEVAMSGRPAVFIPLPQAIYDHQRLNAEALVESGAAELLPQAELTPARLAEVLVRLEQDRRTLQRMAAAAGRKAHPEAATEVADDLVVQLGGGHR